MGKHYNIYSGVRETGKFRRFILTSALFSLFCIGAYSAITNPSGGEGARESNQAIAQAAQTPAVTIPTDFQIPMPWPDYGSSAYLVPKDNLLATSDANAQPVPVASLAKIITALAIMKEKPLQVGEQGPVITLNDQDIAIYREYVRKNGSVVPVADGQQISQYQALQAILMVSANNMSDSVVQRIFGSTEAYASYANQMLKDLGLKNTTVADASGYSPDTVSTAEDMARLGYLYLQNPVLREIAMSPGATIPVAGQIPNYNSFMNEDGIVGLKVGDTDEAGKCLLVAEIRQTEGSPEEMSVAVVLGADSLRTAAKDAQNILKAGNQGHDRLAGNP